MSRKNRGKNKQKGENSPKNSVSLNTNETRIGDTFLGVKRLPGTYNQLWEWDTLKDVVFK